MRQRRQPSRPGTTARLGRWRQGDRARLRRDGMLLGAAADSDADQQPGGAVPEFGCSGPAGSVHAQPGDAGAVQLHLLRLAGLAARREHRHHGGHGGEVHAWYRANDGISVAGKILSEWTQWAAANDQLPAAVCGPSASASALQKQVFGKDPAAGDPWA